jgi:5-methylcytosine-specific restriction endonuclease McrA
VLARDGYTCVYCGATGVALTLDHVTPRAWGGSHHASNLVAACAPCNSARKGDHDLTTFTRKCRIAFGWSAAHGRAMGRRVRAALHRKLPRI